MGMKAKVIANGRLIGKATMVNVPGAGRVLITLKGADKDRRLGVGSEGLNGPICDYYAGVRPGEWDVIMIY